MLFVMIQRFSCGELARLKTPRKCSVRHSLLPRYVPKRINVQGCASCSRRSCSPEWHRVEHRFDHHDWQWWSPCPETYQHASHRRWQSDGLTRNETPLPKVTLPETVKLSNSRQSEILWNRERKSLTWTRRTMREGKGERGWNDFVETGSKFDQRNRWKRTLSIHHQIASIQCKQIGHDQKKIRRGLHR